MMNGIGVNFADDLRQAATDLCNVLTIGGRKYNGTADDERRSEDLIEEGRYAVYERTWTGVLGDFATVPAINATVYMDGIRYAIADVTRNPQTDTIVLALRRSDAQP